MFTLKSPCKVNLYLRLTGKRSDGFNNLVTIFHRLALSDELTFEKRKSGITFSCEDPHVPKDKSNLIIKAYELLQEHGLRGGVAIRLVKRIPIKAGLGGASSNAATTLLGLNRLYRLGLKKQTLMRLGAELGSDVPFFLTHYSLALGIDRGEKIIRLENGNTRFYFVLFVFKEGLSTKDVYQNHRYSKRGISLTKILDDVIMLAHLFKKKDVSAINRISYNALLKPACRLKPEINSLINRLKQAGSPFVQMTGSGSTVYVMVRKKSQAHVIQNRFSSNDPVPFFTSSVS